VNEPGARPRLRGRLRLFLFLLLAGFAAGPPAPGALAASRTFIDIYSPAARKIRLAIPELRPLDGPRDPLGLQIAQVIEEDLSRTGLFYVQDRRSYPENPLQAGIRLEEQKFPEWLNVVKAEGLVKGGYTVGGNSITAEIFLYDTARGAQELGKRFQYPRSSWRLMAHRFANAVLERYTGEKGIFDTQIAFVSRSSPAARGEIYIMDWDGADLRRVTRNGMGNNAPAWSPDGRWLAYSSFKSSPPGVFILPTNGGAEFRVNAPAAQGIGGNFSPDSRFFAYAERTGRTYQLVLYDMATRVRSRLSRSFGIDVTPSFSPDGRRIVFASGRSGGPQIYVMNADGSDPRRISFQGTYNTEPRWSPRGDRIAYSTRVSDHVSIDIVTVNPDGSDLRRLTGAQGKNESPSWSPDGRHLTFSSDRSGRKEIYVMTSAGTELKRLQLGQEPAWSPALP